MISRSIGTLRRTPIEDDIRPPRCSGGELFSQREVVGRAVLGPQSREVGIGMVNDQARLPKKADKAKPLNKAEAKNAATPSGNGGGFSRIFGEIANKTSAAAGRASAFMVAAAVVIVWAVTGPIFNYSDTWQLVINTGTTIVTFLMVFLIQNSQNRDGAAIQVKLDELIRVSAAQNSFVGIEHLTDEELEDIRDRCERRAEAEKAGEASVKRAAKKARKAADRAVAVD
jgi:low affinity Fe/Cu permease